MTLTFKSFCIFQRSSLGIECPRAGTVRQSCRLIFDHKNNRAFGEGLRSRCHLCPGSSILSMRSTENNYFLSQDYTPACSKLIAQFRTALNLVDTEFDVQQFMTDYRLDCRAAYDRLVSIRLPATIEHPGLLCTIYSFR